MAIKTVWIEDGCIACSACETEAPDVFVVTDGFCYVRAAVREDGMEDDNQGAKSPLKASLQVSLEAGIQAAASACPVEVIKFA